MSTHKCPGGCGRYVPVHRFACRSCWFRLPYELRHPITANYRRDGVAHASAMTAARQWYVDQAVPAVPPCSRCGCAYTAHHKLHCEGRGGNCVCYGGYAILDDPSALDAAGQLENALYDAARQTCICLVLDTGRFDVDPYPADMEPAEACPVHGVGAPWTAFPGQDKA